MLLIVADEMIFQSIHIQVHLDNAQFDMHSPVPPSKDIAEISVCSISISETALRLQAEHISTHSHHYIAGAIE